MKEGLCTDQSANSVKHEEIKSRLKSGNACYHSVQNILSSSLLSKNTIKFSDLTWDEDYFCHYRPFGMVEYIIK
jgi:hypothetical protein